MTDVGEVRDAARMRFPDGSQITFRPIGPADGRAVAAFATQLSNDTEYRRFLTAGGNVRTAWVRRLVHADQVDFLADGAFASDAFGETLIAVAESVRDTVDPTRAEFALAATDAWQRLGIGTMLACHLARRARSSGITSWEAFMLADNRAIARILHRVGPKIEGSVDGGILLVAHELAV